MKKVLFVCAIAVSVILFACNTGGNTPEVTPVDSTTVAPDVAPEVDETADTAAVADTTVVAE